MTFTTAFLLKLQNTYFIEELQDLDSEIQIYIYPQTFDQGFEIAQEYDLTGITISNGDITAEEVEIAHSNGLLVTLWDVYSQGDNDDAVEKHPDMIQTDNVDYLVDLLR